MGDVESQVRALYLVPLVNHLLDVVGLGDLDGQFKHVALRDGNYVLDVL